MTPASSGGQGILGGVYVHVPFCSSLCPYCDFAVQKGGTEVRAAYVEALVREIEIHGQQGRFDASLTFDTIYLGGGTPSILDPEQLARILDAIREHLAIADDVMISLEANPEDVDSGSVARWRALGVRTLSLGVQAFSDDELKFLGRKHTGEQARNSVRVALDGGFDAVSVDLIYGLPDQQRDAWTRDLEVATALEPQHLSCYQLTVSDGTAFGRKRARGRLVELSNGRQGELFEFTHGWLCDAGYPAYEVSNFAAEENFRSRHNQKYWDHTPYLGLGPSAHSFCDGRRWWNHRTFAAYREPIEGGVLPVDGEELLSAGDLALETVMLSLRTAGGVDLVDFQRRFGVELVADNRDAIDRWVEMGVMECDDHSMKLTTSGLAIADSVAVTLVS